MFFVRALDTQSAFGGKPASPPLFPKDLFGRPAPPPARSPTGAPPGDPVDEAGGVGSGTPIDPSLRRLIGNSDDMGLIERLMNNPTTKLIVFAALLGGAFILVKRFS